MRPTERLLDQLNRAFGGEAWYGPPLRNLLDGVDEEHAKQHPIAGAHSIFELVVHVRTWMDVVARRIAVSEDVLTTVEDWSDLAGTSWTETLEELEHAESRLVDAVARLSTERLEQKVAGQNHSIHGEVMGVLQHNVYHAGQIAILKRALGIGNA
jgi:uncharacterized damage-inducible protein DinB